MPPSHSLPPDARGILDCQAQCPDTLLHDDLPSFGTIAKEILRLLNKHVNLPRPVCPGLLNHEALSSESLADICTRFQLWTGNLGVMHKATDPRALDRRLLNAPEVASRVREILEGLRDLLEQCELIDSGELDSKC
jgi:hypothetical protein